MRMRMSKLVDYRVEELERKMVGWMSYKGGRVRGKGIIPEGYQYIDTENVNLMEYLGAE